MVEKVLFISCQQPYRRAAQIAFLEYFGYYTPKAKDADVIYGMSPQTHTREEVIRSFEASGVTYVRRGQSELEWQPGREVRWYSEVMGEVIARALVRVLETGKNTIILEDDHYLVMRREALSERLSALDAVVGNVGVVQLHSQLNDTVKNDLPETPIVGAEDFIRGSVRSSHSAFFVTPSGAEQLLAYIRDPETQHSIENGLPRALHAKPWLYSVYYPKVSDFIFKTYCLQGDNCMSALLGRANDRELRSHRYFIEKFRLGNG